MTPVALLLSLFVFGLPVLLYAEIEVKHDRFNGQVSLTTKDDANRKFQLGRPRLSLIGVYMKNGQSRASITVYISNESWRYLECHHMYWLVDGKPFQLPRPIHDGSVGSGYVFEILTISPVSLEQFYQLAEAKKVEFKICNDEYEATPEEMSDFGVFLSKMRENAPKKSP